MTKIAAFTDAERLDPDDVLAEFQDAAMGHTCPYVERCEPRRRRLPHYRPGVACHWVTWRNWHHCPIYRSGGNAT